MAKLYGFGAVALGALTIACSSSSSGGSSSGGSGEFCAQTKAYAAACNENTACDQAIVADCATYSENFSSAYLSAYSSCLTEPYTCEDGGTSSATTCLDEKLASLTPSSAQAKAKTDFCAICPDGASMYFPTSCSNFFAPSADGGSGGIGVAVLEVSDSLATRIDQSCNVASSTDAGFLNDCALAFAFCAEAVVVSTEPSVCLSDAGIATGTSLAHGLLRPR